MRAVLPIVPRPRCISCWTPGWRMSNRVKGDGALERPNPVRYYGSHFTFPSKDGQLQSRSSASLRRPSGKILCSITYAAKTCQCSAPQYQAEGRGRSCDSHPLRENEGRESRIESAGGYGGLQRSVHHPLNDERPDRHTFYTATARTGPSQTMA